MRTKCPQFDTIIPHEKNKVKNFKGEVNMTIEDYKEYIKKEREKFFDPPMM